MHKTNLFNQSRDFTHPQTVWMNRPPWTFCTSPWYDQQTVRWGWLLLRHMQLPGRLKRWESHYRWCLPSLRSLLLGCLPTLLQFWWESVPFVHRPRRIVWLVLWLSLRSLLSEYIIGILAIEHCRDVHNIFFRDKTVMTYLQYQTKDEHPPR